MRKRPLLLCACVFLTGLACQRYETRALLIIPTVFMLGEIYHGRKNKKKMTGRSLLLLSVFLLGLGRMEKEENFRNAYMSKLETESQVTVWGEISKIEAKEYGVRLILSDTYIRLKEETIPCNNIVVYSSSTHFSVGEIHKITGQLNRFQNVRNEGNFDSEVYNHSIKQDFSIWAEEEDFVYLGFRENLLRDFLLVLKEKLSKVYDTHLETKAAGFYVGMILGNKEGLEEETKDLFTLGGISHILAISGLHVSIIGRGFYNFLRKFRLGFLGAGLWAALLLLAYCNMVGNGMSAVRAVGMMLIMFLGQVLGRSYDMLNALGGMILVLLWDNPFLLEYSGFWLSVTALIGVGVVGKVLWMPLATALATLPILSFSYYEIPLYSPLVNFIVLPVLTPIFCLALIGGLVGLFFPELANFILIPCQWLLYFYEGVCTVAKSLPGASIITGKPSMAMMVIYYVVLGVGCFVLGVLKKKGKAETSVKGENQAGAVNRNRIARIFVKEDRVRTAKGIHVHRMNVVCSICLCMGCLFLMAYPKQQPFEVSFLDVGQGDGIYFSDGKGVTCFIDGGSTSEEMVGEYRILPFLKSRGIREIDYWFISHADADHISGLIEVLEDGYAIEYLVVSAFAPKDNPLENLLSLAESQGTEIVYMKAGERIVSKEMEITCLYPWTEVTDKNDGSLVLEVETSGLKMLFAGDISSEVEKLLLEKRNLSPVDIYKVSHHGSKYSNSIEFLECLQPKLAVVSCGKKNLYGHPALECIERLKAVGCEVRYTMEEGQVKVREPYFE